MKKTALATIILLLFAPTALALSTTTAPAASAPATPAAFSDVPQTHDDYVAISYLSSAGIVKGYSDGTFKPGQMVNRAESLKIILEGNKVTVPADVTTTTFSDVKPADWFAKYVETAKTKGIIAGNPDGTFAPGRNISRAEFLKILLNSNGFNPDKWKNQALFSDVPADAWYNPYMNYAGQAGLLTKDDKNNLYPSKELSRAEVAEIYYLLTVIRQGHDTQFLLNQAESQMTQIETYITAQKPIQAKRASELSVDMTQQAFKNLPENNIVLGAAKLARSYDFLVNAYITAVQKQPKEATDWANQAITKATEAWEANNDLQAICKHIKDRANEILTQIATA